jgi:hypothetical protein
VPSTGTQALTALRFSKRTERSTWRSRTSGNFESGSTLDGLLEIVDERGAGHAGLAVDRIAQEPQISSRQLES